MNGQQEVNQRTGVWLSGVKSQVVQGGETILQMMMSVSMQGSCLTFLASRSRTFALENVG